MGTSLTNLPRSRPWNLPRSRCVHLSARIEDFAKRIRKTGKKWAFERRVLARRRPHLIAMGDSHTYAVAGAARLRFVRARVSLCQVGGATAQGLRNPNSRTGARRIFEQRCDRAQTWQNLVFLLGEVDCGFGIWYWAERHGTSVTSQMRRSIDSYTELLRRQIRRGFRVFVLSVPLPAIADGGAEPGGSIASVRSRIDATQRERTELTLEYNAQLSASCVEIGAIFVDATTPMLDATTGLIKHEYLGKKPFDPHLKWGKYAYLVGSALMEALAHCDSGDGSADPPQTRSVDHRL